MKRYICTYINSKLTQYSLKANNLCCQNSKLRGSKSKFNINTPRTPPHTTNRQESIIDPMHVLRSTQIGLHQAHDMLLRWAHLTLLTSRAPSPLLRWTQPEFLTFTEQSPQYRDQGTMPWEDFVCREIIGAQCKFQESHI